MSYYRNPPEYPQQAYNEFYRTMEEGSLTFEDNEQIFLTFAHLVAIAGEDHPLVLEAANDLATLINANYLPMTRGVEEDFEGGEEEDDFDEEEDDFDGEWHEVKRSEWQRTEEPSAYHLIVYVSVDLDQPIDDTVAESIMNMDFNAALSMYLDMLTEVIGRDTDHHGVDMQGNADFGWEYETLTEAKAAQQDVLDDPRLAHLKTTVRAF